MSEFDFGAEPDIPGEQANYGRLFLGPKFVDHLQNSRQDISGSHTQHLLEEKHITFEKAFEVLWARLDLVSPEKIANDGSIGPARKSNFGRSIRNVEHRVANT